jgi:hypothetical protein
MDTTQYLTESKMRVEGSGWIGFAGTMMVIVGFVNIIDGIAAISDRKYLATQLLFSNMHAWGWFFLIWGIIQILAGLAIYGGASWGAFVGIIAASFNFIAQLSWVHTNTAWALSAMVLDVLVIYALVVYGGQARDKV